MVIKVHSNFIRVLKSKVHIRQKKMFRKLFGAILYAKNIHEHISLFGDLYLLVGCHRSHYFAVSRAVFAGIAYSFPTLFGSPPHLYRQKKRCILHILNIWAHYMVIFFLMWLCFALNFHRGFFFFSKYFPWIGNLHKYKEAISVNKANFFKGMQLLRSNNWLIYYMNNYTHIFIWCFSICSLSSFIINLLSWLNTEYAVK